jgi:hypothetical protein
MNSFLMPHQSPCERVWWRCLPHRQVHFFHRRISSVRASNIPHILVDLSTVDHSSACPAQRPHFYLVLGVYKSKSEICNFSSV